MNRDEIARYAYENVPFYRDLLNHDIISWEDIPIIDKKMLQEKVDSAFSPEYMMDYLKGDLEHVMTSGSTGDCLDIFWKREHNMKSLIPLWKKRQKYYGILPDDKRCYFFTTKVINGRELECEETESSLGFSKMDLSEKKLLEMYDKMLSFNPKWIIAQPSMMLLFINAIKKYNLRRLKRLEYIELTGERITDIEEQKITNFFECKVASQYGCYETNSIAYECPCGSMHVMSENVYVEIVEEKDICITSLHNKVMPFIRYKIGDRGSLTRNHCCPCGNREPIIKLDMARDNDWIYNSDGSRSHSDLFCNVINMINLQLQQVIMQYQIVQTDYKEFEVYLVINDKDASSFIMELFIKYYEKYQERSMFNFFFVDFLYPSEKTGKLAWFISKKGR